jgi:hypothetical protein
MMFFLECLFGLVLFACCGFFFLRSSDCLVCWGRRVLGQLMHVVWGSSQLSRKCAWGVRFLEVGHVR